MRKLFVLLALFMVALCSTTAQLTETKMVKNSSGEFTPPPLIVIKTGEKSGSVYKTDVSPLTGVKTIKNSGGDFASFTEAIGYINAYGVGTGGVTFNVAADAVFYEDFNYITCSTSSATNPIVFQKDGAGANPIIYGKALHGGDWDPIIGFYGSDYITFDGIDLASDPAATLDADKVEYGFSMSNNSALGCDHITIKNCCINIERRSDTNQQNGINSWQDATSITGIISNVLIDNVTFVNGRTSINFNTQAIPNENIEVKNCKFGEVATSIQPLDYGSVLFLNKCKNFSIHDNEIQNIVTTNFSVIAMDYFTGENHVYNNKIHNLRYTSTAEASDLMVISPYSNDANAILNIYNNLIYDFDGAKSSSTLTLSTYWNLTILYITGTAKYRVYNNTIVGSSSNQHENTMLCWATSTTEIKNNIFADFSVPGANSFRTLFLSSGVIENNLFWIDETLTNNYTYRSQNINYKFREWQKWNTIPSPGYFLSNMSANPNFTNRAAFDFTLVNPSPASNNGQPIGIVTSDLNGVARNASTPDIGAYEGDFGPATDLFPPIIRFQPIPHNSLDVVKLTAEITDNVGVTDAKLWYRAKSSTVAFTQVLGVQYGNIWEFTFPTLSAGVYEYFVCAKDASNNVISNGYIVTGLDAANTGLSVNNPSASPDYVYNFAYNQILAGGTYTVGTGGTYTSLTKTGGLFDAINSSLIAGDIGVTIISDLDETGTYALQQWQESGTGNYTLTIKPSSATLRTISNNTTTNPISILGADRITIDGSYNGDNLNHLKFTMNITNPLIFNNNGTNGCNNITVKFCDFYSLSAMACIAVLGSNHSDFLFENVNSFKGSSGLSLSNVNRLIIRNCTFGSTDVYNSLSFRGIYLSGCLDILVEGNTVRNIINSVDNSSALGIWLYNVNGGSVSRNKITGVKNNATIGNEESNGLFVQSSRNIIISNNIISDINGYGSPTIGYNFGIVGAVLAYCDNVKYYYNTINLYGEGNAVDNAESFTLNTDYSTNLDVCNNVFLNSIYNSNPNSYSEVLSQKFYELSNNFRNNIYYNSGTNAYPQTFLISGGWPVFRGWQSAGYTPGNGRDLGSGYGEPMFTNSLLNDVSLQSSSPAINSGIPLSITTDFNGNTRSTTTPDIGAIEDNSMALATDMIAPVISYTPFANIANTTPTFSATITDNVGVTAAKMWYRLKSSTDAFTGVTGVQSVNTWSFTFISALTPDTEYEYFICAKDVAGNIITNGINSRSLDATAVGLTNNAPAANPTYVRIFKVTDFSITLGTIAGAPYLVSNIKTASVNIPYTITGTYTSNTFEAYLSDATGNFTSEIMIGSIVSDVSGTINAIIPAAKPSGTNYLIRVKSTNPAGIISTISPPFQIINDNATPVVTLTSSSVSPVYLPFPVTIEFNEIVIGFTQSMITATNATLGDFSTITTNKKFTVLVTPISSGAVTVKVAANQVKDFADNYNGESNTINLSYIELGVPHLNITAAGDVNYFNTSPITLTFTFDQDVTGFISTDITVTNGSVSSFAGSGSVYSASLTPTGQGQVKISVADDAVINAASKGNSASSLNLTYDNVEPGVSLSRVSGSGTVNSAFDIYVDFDEEIEGMILDKFTVTNGAASNLIRESGTRYRATINPSINSGTITISFLANKITDLAGNSNTAASNLDVTVLSTQPVVSVSRTSGTGKVNGAFNITFTFGIDVTDFEVGDIVVTNGTLGVLSGSGASYTVDVTPTADGEVKIKVPQGVAQDVASNLNLASNELLVIADMTVPTLIITRTSGSGSVNGKFNVSISFSEVVTGFDISDITASGATLSNFTESGSLYQVDVTPTATGDVTVSVAASKATDNAGNGNTASNSLLVVADLTAPTVVISRTTGTGVVNAKFNVTLTFSEDVTGFDVSDISVTNGAASAFVATTATVYTADVTPAATGDVTVSVAASKATDNAGNGNTASNSLVVVADITAPTVVISRTTGTGVVNAKFNVTLTFSEDVTGFDVSDISVTNGAASAFVATTATVYTADVTPTVAGNVIINVAANVAQDLAGNSNTAASPLNIEYAVTGIEILKFDSFNVFPNPSSGVFKIEVTNLLNQSIKIFDLNGRLVYSNRIKNNITEVELHSFPKGTYLLQLVEGNKTSTKEIVMY